VRRGEEASGGGRLPGNSVSTLPCAPTPWFSPVEESSRHGPSPKILWEAGPGCHERRQLQPSGIELVLHDAVRHSLNNLGLKKKLNDLLAAGNEAMRLSRKRFWGLWARASDGQCAVAAFRS
jgi:hypothetical protein